MFRKRQPQRPSEWVTCAQCCKEFSITASRREKSISGNVFCSPQCAGQHYATTLPQNATCHSCSKVFHRSPSELAREDTRNVYCSTECYRLAQRAGKSVRQPVLWSDEEQVPCDNCRKLIHRPPAHLQAHKHHFCSRECMGQFYTTSGVGAITENRERSILERGARCAVCGENDFDVLVIHHIDGNRKNNRYENLMVVCANCHWRIHKGILTKLSALLKRR